MLKVLSVLTPPEIDDMSENVHKHYILVHDAADSPRRQSIGIACGGGNDGV